MGDGFSLQAMGDGEPGHVVEDIERSCTECGQPVSECHANILGPKREVTLDQVKRCVRGEH